MDEGSLTVMKVFQGIIEIAGQMGILSGALKRRGHIATGYNTFHSYLGYRDHLINTTLFEIQNMARHLYHFFDVFHFHYASTIMNGTNGDLPLLKAIGKKMIMHHWGNDIRFHDMARINNPYVFTGDSPPNIEIANKLAHLSSYISEAIVQDYEVYAYAAPYYQKVHVLPIAIDLHPFPPLPPSPTNTRPLVVHAPTNPEFKGTVYIENAISQLSSQYAFDYRRVEKMNHQEAIQLYQNADIIIDQIRCGSYGLLSVEAMALAKPVMTYIREDLVPTFPGLPIVNSNPDTIYQQLKMLLDHPQLRHEIGLRGRQYVENVHDSNRVVDQLLTIYAGLRP